MIHLVDEKLNRGGKVFRHEHRASPLPKMVTPRALFWGKVVVILVLEQYLSQI